jgi:hypothetical protein
MDSKAPTTCAEVRRYIKDNLLKYVVVPLKEVCLGILNSPEPSPSSSRDLELWILALYAKGPALPQLEEKKFLLYFSQYMAIINWMSTGMVSQISAMIKNEEKKQN